MKIDDGVTKGVTKEVTKAVTRGVIERGPRAVTEGVTEVIEVTSRQRRAPIPIRRAVPSSKKFMLEIHLITEPAFTPADRLRYVAELLVQAAAQQVMLEDWGTIRGPGGAAIGEWRVSLLDW